MGALEPSKVVDANTWEESREELLIPRLEPIDRVRCDPAVRLNPYRTHTSTSVFEFCCGF